MQAALLRIIRLVPLLLLALSPLAQALQKGTTPSGYAWASGGSSEEELATLRAARGNYSFWLTTAARGSGAYLAGVDVRITETGSKRSMLEYKMDGPWLFVSLPAGHYTVEATVANGRGGKPETQRTTADVSGSEQHRATLYFDTGDKVSDDAGVARPGQSPQR